MALTNRRYFRYFIYIQPVLKTPIVRTYGSAILTIVTSIIFIIFAIKPTVETILILQKNLADSQEVLNKISEKSATLIRAQENYQKLPPTTKSKIYSSLPTQIELKNLLQALEGAARKNDATISAIQLQPVSLTVQNNGSKTTVEEISFTFNIEGTYEKSSGVLQQLFKDPRIISLNNLILSKADTGDIIMSVSGKTYYLK